MVFKSLTAALIAVLISFSKCYSSANEIVFQKMDSTEYHSAGSDSLFSFRSKKGFVPSLIHNFGEQAAAPFKMNAKQAWMVAGGVAVTGALFLIDKNIDDVFQPLKEKSKWIGESSWRVSEFGGNYSFAFLAAFSGYSLLSKDRKGIQATLLAVQAAITSGVWVRVGKILSGRERPSATYKHCNDDFWWGPFSAFNSEKSNHRDVSYFDAFPSGHTATAFAIASVFANQYADKPFVPVFSYSMASLVGISRLTEHTHWASDVFAGACIGYLCGRQVVKSRRQLESSSSALKIKSQYYFSINGSQPTLNCLFTF